MRYVSVLLCLLLSLAAAGCGASAEQVEVDRDEIRAYLESYLPVLAEAYAAHDARRLEGLVAIKEVARIQKLIDDLAAQGRSLEPAFRELTIEEVNVFNYSNAYVTSLEVWDVRALATGTEVVLSEEIGKRYRVRYQLKREDGRWRALYRSIQE